MKQVLIIHGGDTFDTDADYQDHLMSLELDYDRLLYRPRWKEWLAHQLPGVDVLLPTFPNANNAKYDEWVIYFEKILTFLEDGAIVIGHSLGGIFLSKYLNNHTLNVSHIVLVAAPFDDEEEESLASFRLPSQRDHLKIYQDKLTLFHSEDDVVVPFGEMKKYHHLLPNANIVPLKERGHCNTPTFPELLTIINKKLPS